MNYQKLSLVMSVLVLLTFGAAAFDSKKEYVLLSFDYDPFPKSMPGLKEWMEHFSTPSPLNYTRRRLVNLLKNKSLRKL